MKSKAIVLVAAFVAAACAQAADQPSGKAHPDRAARREALRHDIQEIAAMRADREQAHHLEKEARKRGDVAEATKQLQREMADTARIRAEKQKFKEIRAEHRREHGHGGYVTNGGATHPEAGQPSTAPAAANAPHISGS